MSAMGKRQLNNWRWWLQTFSTGLLIFATFAPISETLHGILTPVGLGGLFIYLSVDSPAFRKWVTRFLIPLAALALLAPLLSVNPKWVFFGGLALYAGTCVWGVFRREHAEYLADRERFQ